MLEYQKLVRDKIPHIIRAANEEPVIRFLGDDEYKEALLAKLREESLELCLASDKSGIIRESADVREVLVALCVAFEIPVDLVGIVAMEFTDVSHDTPRTALVRRSNVGFPTREKSVMRSFIQEYYGAFLYVLSLYHITIGRVIAEQEKIRELRGGFSERIFLVEVK